jgi:hypothetical protein
MVLARTQAMCDTCQECRQQQLPNHGPQVQTFQSPQLEDYPGCFLQPNQQAYNQPNYSARYPEMFSNIDQQVQPPTRQQVSAPLPPGSNSTPSHELNEGETKITASGWCE